MERIRYQRRPQKSDDLAHPYPICVFIVEFVALYNDFYFPKSIPIVDKKHRKDARIRATSCQK